MSWTQVIVDLIRLMGEHDGLWIRRGRNCALHSGIRHRPFRVIEDEERVPIDDVLDEDVLILIQHFNIIVRNSDGDVVFPRLDAG